MPPTSRYQETRDARLGEQIDPDSGNTVTSGTARSWRGAERTDDDVRQSLRSCRRLATAPAHGFRTARCNRRRHHPPAARRAHDVESQRPRERVAPAPLGSPRATASTRRSRTVRSPRSAERRAGAGHRIPAALILGVEREQRGEAVPRPASAIPCPMRNAPAAPPPKCRSFVARRNATAGWSCRAGTVRSSVGAAARISSMRGRSATRSAAR